ncbi:hypothetical protein [Tunturiibacter gelidiferens]|uniref:hypothetical protein n=1 Tax=Tunturiibacter gelidiferens TaxID=3069689 RepID=UPI003D9B3B08
MPNQTELDKMAADTSAMWLDEFDHQRAEYAQTKKPQPDAWEDFGGVARPGRNFGAAADLENDTATQNELARRDPNGFGVKLAEIRQEKVVNEFRRLNPSYVPNEKNQKAVYKYIRDFQLQDSNLHLDDVDDEAYKAGLWTVENLTQVFRHLSAKGRLDMPAKTIKALSREEKLDVISYIRTGSLQDAVVAYITHSYGGNLPHYSSARDLFTRYPDLASSASKFVFYHSRGTISQADWEAFDREKLAGVPILTFELIRVAYDDWVFLRELNKDAKAAVVAAPAPPSEEDLNQLSDEELNKRIIEEQKQWRRNQF